MSAWKESILRSFDEASATYDGAAATQRRIAGALCRRILALPLPPAPEVLEIGCGTGLLTALLRPALPGCRWLATDLSPGMVAACARRLDPGRHADLETRVMDGEWPDLQERRFDLVVSSLAVQWFGATVAGLCRLRRLLRAGRGAAFVASYEVLTVLWERRP